jgi:hypothetical protein
MNKRCNTCGRNNCFGKCPYFPPILNHEGDCINWLENIYESIRKKLERKEVAK